MEKNIEKLSGKSLLIGKDPAQGRLMVAMVGGKTATIGLPGSVPAGVSRCKPAENVAHARLTFDSAGRMTLTNLKPQNRTFVNGSEIESKRIAYDSSVALGDDRFVISLPLIVEAAVKLLAAPAPQPQPQDSAGVTVRIGHLERVWNDYHYSLRRLREKQRKINLVRSGCGIFTMCAMPCIFFLGPVGYALTGIGVLGNIYSFVGLKNDNTADEQERLTEEFQDRYVCPNPACNKFLGNMSYRLLRKQYSMHCPYCKCKYE